MVNLYRLPGQEEVIAVTQTWIVCSGDFRNAIRVRFATSARCPLASDSDPTEGPYPKSAKLLCSERTPTHADHHTTGERPPSTLIAVPVM